MDARPFLRVVAPRSKDEHVERAMNAMKAAPMRHWTVASLARLAGLSRAPFARRFARAEGLPPLRWLTRHRMDLARARLLESDVPLSVVAGEVGYTSEFAFAKAFRRTVGIPPGTFRRRARGVPRLRAAA